MARRIGRWGWRPRHRGRFADPSRPAACWMLRPAPHSAQLTCPCGPSVLAESRMGGWTDAGLDKAAPTERGRTRRRESRRGGRPHRPPGTELARRPACWRPGSVSAGRTACARPWPGRVGARSGAPGRTDRAGRVGPAGGTGQRTHRGNGVTGTPTRDHGSSDSAGFQGAERNARTCGPRTRRTSASSLGAVGLADPTGCAALRPSPAQCPCHSPAPADLLSYVPFGASSRLRSRRSSCSVTSGSRNSATAGPLRLTVCAAVLGSADIPPWRTEEPAPRTSHGQVPGH